MPIYEYQCKECGEYTEKLQKIRDPVLTYCYKCNKDSLVKQVSAPPFQLKGNGWYATDFKDKGKKKESKDENGSKQTDSKTADKNTNKPVDKKNDTKSPKDKKK